MEAAAAAQAGLDLARGPLLRAHMDLGHGRPARLLLAAHHLAVDVHSWRILLEDLEAAYRGAALKPPTSSFGEWARHLDAYAGVGVSTAGGVLAAPCGCGRPACRSPRRAGDGGGSAWWRFAWTRARPTFSWPRRGARCKW
jgi:hypothetical protein